MTTTPTSKTPSVTPAFKKGDIVSDKLTKGSRERGVYMIDSDRDEAGFYLAFGVDYIQYNTDYPEGVFVDVHLMCLHESDIAPASANQVALFKRKSDFEKARFAMYEAKAKARLTAIQA